MEKCTYQHRHSRSSTCLETEPWTQPHNESLQGNVDTLTLLTQVVDGRYQPLTPDGQSLNSRISV